MNKKFESSKILLLVLLLGVVLTACSSKGNSEISVITREEGSGTRSAFVEIVGILEKNEAGEESDMTSVEAVVQNNTEAVLTSVGSNVNAIGYISLGSLNDSVRALKVDGVEATAENVKAGDYKIQRPFNIVYDAGVSDGVQDFLKFIKSDEGQKIAEEEGYIADMSGEEYNAVDNQESITIAGSTSITPLMEKLVESYKKFNPLFKADIQATGSSAGVQSVQEGSAEIGMVSRELKDSESNLGNEVIARDGIVVINNLESEIDNLSLEDIKSIFKGEKTTWE
ncbi:MAG: phosphate ABC transporter substrate-binding protein [Tissierellia bacterium]|nr:phosphate ABC transporter substrate-binding protein [Tissierellia bacterium]